MSCSYKGCQNLPIALCKQCESIILICQHHLNNHSRAKDHHDFEDFKSNLDLLLAKKVKNKQKAVLNQIIEKHEDMISFINIVCNFTMHAVSNINLNFRNHSDYVLKIEEIQAKVKYLVQIYENMKKILNDFMNNHNIEEKLKKLDEIIRTERFENYINSEINKKLATGTTKNTSLRKEIIFISTVPTLPNTDVYITGSCSELGNWDIKKCIKLEWRDCLWIKKITFESRDFEFKYFIKLPDGTIYWESGYNNKAEINKCAVKHSCFYNSDKDLYIFDFKRFFQNIIIGNE